MKKINYYLGYKPYRPSRWVPRAFWRPSKRGVNSAGTEQAFFTLLKNVSIKKARFGSKKERIRHFSYEHTYYDAVFDQKEKKS